MPAQKTDMPAAPAAGSAADAARPVARALLSVSDKRGLVELGRFLAGRGVEILSTGGTAQALAEAGIEVKEVAVHTGFPEMMGGRIKTLHPRIHGGILGRRHEGEDQAAMAAHGIAAIDLVVVNLYPFEETVSAGAGEAQAIETIDIGGPAMIRSAAKNHADVAVVVDPEDYDLLIEEMGEKGGTTLAFRRRLAGKAFRRTAAYDAAIAQWFGAAEEDDFPERLTVTATRRFPLRYGENPHQRGAFYGGHSPAPGIATAEQVQGREVSYNNLNDADAAFELVAEFAPARPAVAIIKHAIPCGVALGASLAEAYRRALLSDPVSAFGGIIAVNRPLDAEAAEEIVKIVTDVVIAPEIDEEARKILRRRRNLRAFVTGGMPDPARRGILVKSAGGGLLVQDRDFGRVQDLELRTVTKRAPSEDELRDLRFAFIVAKHVRSNAIIYAKDEATTGIGSGQTSRVDAARIAARKAEDAAREAGLAHSLAAGSVVASDAFFPFADGLLAAAEAGATAVIQPGGSIRDEEVIAAADEAGLAMVLTGMRHFRH